MILESFNALIKHAPLGSAARPVAPASPSSSSLHPALPLLSPLLAMRRSLKRLRLHAILTTSQAMAAADKNRWSLKHCWWKWHIRPAFSRSPFGSLTTWSTEYIEAVIEFTRAYITIIDLVYAEQRVPARF